MIHKLINFFKKNKTIPENFITEEQVKFQEKYPFLYFHHSPMKYVDYDFKAIDTLIEVNELDINEICDLWTSKLDEMLGFWKLISYEKHLKLWLKLDVGVISSLHNSASLRYMEIETYSRLKNPHLLNNLDYFVNSFHSSGHYTLYNNRYSKMKIKCLFNKHFNEKLNKSNVESFMKMTSEQQEVIIQGMDELLDVPAHYFDEDMPSYMMEEIRKKVYANKVKQLSE